jgi:hypothetical protein
VKSLAAVFLVLCSLLYSDDASGALTGYLAMLARVMTLHFDAVLGGFDDTPLREFLFREKLYKHLFKEKLWLP